MLGCVLPKRFNRACYLQVGLSVSWIADAMSLHILQAGRPGEELDSVAGIRCLTSAVVCLDSHRRC